MNVRFLWVIAYLVIYGPVLAFFLFVNFLNFNWPLLILLGAFGAILIFLVRKVCMRENISFIPLIIAAWFFGIVYGVALVYRAVFVIQEGGMERRGGFGSPMAFLLGMIVELLFLGLPALAFTLVAIFCSEKKLIGPN